MTMKIKYIYNEDGKRMGARISDIPKLKLIDKKPSLWNRIKSKLRIHGSEKERHQI